MSQITKRALAASLKKMLERTTLDKITVVDLAEDCGVNRQTFYYHFQDIYDLTEWIFLDETTRALGDKTTSADWQEGFLRIFRWVQDNRNLVRNAYRSVSREALERHLYDVTHGLLLGVVKEQAAGRRVEEKTLARIANFFQYAFVGLLLEWIAGGMREDPEELVDFVHVLIQGDIEKALTHYAG